jgi:hypothetical protein
LSRQTNICGSLVLIFLFIAGASARSDAAIKYSEARDTFDHGDYKKAARMFEDLIAKSGPGPDTMHLEESQLAAAYVMLGQFDKAYDWLVRIPKPNMRDPQFVEAGGSFDSDKARQAVQSLLDQIALWGCTESHYYNYLALAGIMKHLGRDSEAQAFSEEARINKEAYDAYVLIRKKQNNSGRAADAAAAVYERENRPTCADERKKWAVRYRAAGDSDDSN